MSLGAISLSSHRRVSQASGGTCAGAERAPATDDGDISCAVAMRGNRAEKERHPRDRPARRARGGGPSHGGAPDAPSVVRRCRSGDGARGGDDGAAAARRVAGWHMRAAARTAGWSTRTRRNWRRRSGSPPSGPIGVRRRSAAASGGAPDEDHPERGEETVAVAGLGAGWSRRAEARRSRAGRLAGRRPQGSDDRGRECARLRAGSHLRHPRRACGSATAAAAALGHALAREPGATSLRRCGRRDPLGPADVEWLRRSPAASICRREVAAPTALRSASWRRRRGQTGRRRPEPSRCRRRR